MSEADQPCRWPKFDGIEIHHLEGLPPGALVSKRRDMAVRPLVFEPMGGRGVEHCFARAVTLARLTRPSAVEAAHTSFIIYVNKSWFQRMLDEPAVAPITKSDPLWQNIDNFKELV